MGNNCNPVGTMAGDDEDSYPINPNPHEIQSQNADLVSYIIFYNRTCRKIDILWCNYLGNEVRYKTLRPKTFRAQGETVADIDKYSAYAVNTFVSHPWIARDSCDGNLLRVNHGKYFLPRPYQGEQRRQPVYIDIPVFTLRERCLEEVRKLMNVDNLSADEIPASLISSLRNNQTGCVLKYEES